MFDSDALLKELLATFELEAQEHLGELSSLLLRLEREKETAERQRLVEGIFRRVHTLKGAAHAVNLPDIAHTCQQLEDVLADLKRGDLAMGLDVFDALHGEINGLNGLIFGDDQHARGGFAPLRQQVMAASPSAAVIEAAATTLSAQCAAPVPQAGTREHAGHAGKERPVTSRPQGDDTVRVAARRLEELLLQSEELVPAKLAASALQEELAAFAGELAARQGERSRALEAARRALKGATSRREAALAALVEQSCHNDRLTEGRLRLLEKSAEKQARSLQAVIDPLLEEMKKLQLLPFSSITDTFAKLVRDLSRELGKEAELACLGGEMEIDRRILAELKEPLLHLIRNAVDHGVESPQGRAAAGKPAKASIGMELRLKDANHAELILRDDGRGIDVALVKEAALRQEFATAAVLERMPEAELLQLIFESGVSTSSIISDISGRGVGLAIVRQSVERLGGGVAVSSTPGAGTVFRLTVPLSFARMRGLLVQVGGRDCAIAAANVVLSSRVPLAGVKRVENRDTVLVNGELFPLVSLARILEVKRSTIEPDATLSFVLLHAGEKRIAFVVDQVLGVQDILVKPLGSQLARVRNVTGATVLGNGRLAPVLRVADLFRCAMTLEGTVAPPHPPEPAKPGRVSVLVAEDSITSRTLLKNILESAGYHVCTAVDGADALARLKTQKCDIVVSDIEMPRMDGFQLTSAIRADNRLAALPVILVTGLESSSDRERGIDVGASAYLVKSSFDQTSLIEVIQKLAG